MKRLVTFILFLFLITLRSNYVFAEKPGEFAQYMNEWNEKRELASDLLLEAEKEFKLGDEISGCSAQRKASKFGIEATTSLIKAMEINGDKNGIENIEAGLRKWKELGDFC